MTSRVVKSCTLSALIFQQLRLCNFQLFLQFSLQNLTHLLIVTSTSWLLLQWRPTHNFFLIIIVRNLHLRDCKARLRELLCTPSNKLMQRLRSEGRSQNSTTNFLKETPALRKGIFGPLVDEISLYFLGRNAWPRWPPDLRMRVCERRKHLLVHFWNFDEKFRWNFFIFFLELQREDIIICILLQYFNEFCENTFRSRIFKQTRLSKRDL